MSEEIETKAVYLAHNKLKNFADVVDVSTSFKSSAFKVKQGFKYNVLVLFHMQEIQQDEQLAEFSTLLNIEEEVTRKMKIYYIFLNKLKKKEE